MKCLIILTFVLTLFALEGISQMKDIEGNLYQTVTIGKQIWMAENLRTSKFKNGDPIPLMSQESDWNMTFEEEKPGRCILNNEAQNEKKYGFLYNWYAATDKRGIAPNGWRVPRKEDWEELLRYLIKKDELSDIDTISAPLIRATVSWGYPGFSDFKSNNRSGFTALAAGYRLENGFAGENLSAFFWSSTENEETELPYYLSIQGPYATLENFHRKMSGFSIRLIKAETK